jgi:predicted metal-binding membrane protein
MRAILRRDLFLPAIGSLVAVAWLTLWVWERSPYGRYLSHAELGHLALDGGESSAVVQAGLYVVGWTVMTVAMMLPTTVPLIEIFRRMTRDHARRGQLVGALVLGYLGIWLAFGVAAHVLDWGLHRVVHRTPWLHARSWLLGSGLLLLAGAFQFSSLKYRCLDECRSPLSFVIQHWQNRRGRLQALWLGVHHGLFCVGCCWALMLLMFAVGTGNVGWMLLLGAVMAIEKNLPGGRRFAAPVGAVLMVWGIAIVLYHMRPWAV